MSSERYRLHDRIFWFSAVAVAFFLPVFGRVVPILILILILNWLIDGRFVKNIRHVFQEKRRRWTFSFALLYILYLAGMLYTTNFGYGWFDLEIKMSMFLFPLVFATSPWPLFPEERSRLVPWFFVAGCITGALILLGRAAVNEYAYGISSSFYYMKLSWYFHASYLSMYYNFAIGFLFLQLFQQYHRRRSIAILIGGLILFLMVMVLLLVSKAGLLTMVIIIIAATLYAWFRLKNGWLGAAISGGVLILFFIAYLIAPVIFSRVAGAERAIVSAPVRNRVKAESNADRMAVWSTSAGIIKKHFLFGVGTGDVKDALLDGYRENNLIPALRHKFNAHSQFIQTFVTLGLTGFLVLLASLLLPAINAMRRGQVLYLVFLLIFTLNILFESMLEIQQGVVFYAFFNIFLFTSSDADSRKF